MESSSVSKAADAGIRKFLKNWFSLLNNIE